MSAPVFSYAQAAKGLAPSSQTASGNASSASSDHGTKENSVTSDTSGLQIKPKQSSSNVDEQTSSKDHELATAPETTKKDHEDVPVTSRTVSNERIPQQTESPPQNAVSIATSEAGVSQQKDELITSPEDGATVANNKEVSNLSPLDNYVQEGEKEKSKEVEDDWEKVSIPSIAAEKELKAAPPPSVNIWQQRKEAQAAKMKETVPQRPASISAPVRQKSQGQSNERKAPAKEQVSVDNTTVSGRKAHSNSRGSRDVSSTQPTTRPTSQQAEKARNVIPPPANDTEFWPTPETAIPDERRKSTTNDKSEKAETKANTQKKWVSIPFVPTAKFETQLPPAAHSRRGGRASNRGRGGYNGQSERANEKTEQGSMAPPPLPKHVSEQDRGRKNEAIRDKRASSVPLESPRNTSVESDVPQVSATRIRDTFSSAGNKGVQTTTSTTNATNENPNTMEHASRSHSKAGVQDSVPRKSEDTTKGAITNHTQASVATEFDASSRSFIKSEQSKSSTYEANRVGSNETDRENASFQGREWQKDRNSSSREKGDSWRERREPRAERGRGNFRGRGNHNNFNGHNSGSHPYTAPLPQNGFDAPKPAALIEGRNRQASQPFSAAQPLGGNRNNPRSQSIPIGMVQAGYYPPPQGFQPPLAPIQTDAAFNGYGGHMPSSIMSAMPYSDQLNSYALLSMVITQLEYYFSIDNLCKDMFLRKNMDSQGFVPLSVIANFKRIKALTADNQMSYDHLRSVCHQVKNVEYVTTDDGDDRLRSRENWRDFVLPIEDRLPLAQNEGPSFQRHQSRPLSALNPEFNFPHAQLRSPPPYMNGFHESPSQQMNPVPFAPIAGFDGQREGASSSQSALQTGEQVRRSSATSPFSKIQSPPQPAANTVLTNGHRASASALPDNENIFPDEKISELKVVVRDPDYIGDHLSNEEDSARVSGLRGGASSPAQLERFRNLQFGQAMSGATGVDDQPIFWTKDGEPARIPVRPGFVHEDYLSLHDKALSQRSENHLDGALAVLYAFWSSFLVSNFNLAMYQEFCQLVSEDVQNGNDIGKKHLAQFYETLLVGKNPMSDRTASDFVRTARKESEGNGIEWQKLRSAWRNGATNLKTRKRLGDLLTSEEKAKLDKGT